jgi:IS30 family transposase
VDRLREEVREREMHHLAELGKERRKVVLAQTELRNERLQIEQERQDILEKMSIMDLQLDEFAKMRAQNEAILWRSERFAELSAGIKEGYFQDEDDKVRFVDLVKEVSNFGRQHLVGEKDVLRFPGDGVDGSEDR